VSLGCCVAERTRWCFVGQVEIVVGFVEELLEVGSCEFFAFADGGAFLCLGDVVFFVLGC
jgi:hypothetical protein